ncbi:uncharacterized protein LOC143039582 [Oratosquilla oratoria]|uniref:uncharacterized protein LOC143039582 n=1 Tax=Oratosquilla oratoria TaxID=337810 RepID=UPI003F77194D
MPLVPKLRRPRLAGLSGSTSHIAFMRSDGGAGGGKKGDPGGGGGGGEGKGAGEKRRKSWKFGEGEKSMSSADLQPGRFLSSSVFDLQQEAKKDDEELFHLINRTHALKKRLDRFDDKHNTKDRTSRVLTPSERRAVEAKLFNRMTPARKNTKVFQTNFYQFQKAPGVQLPSPVRPRKRLPLNRSHSEDELEKRSPPHPSKNLILGVVQLEVDGGAEGGMGEPVATTRRARSEDLLAGDSEGDSSPFDIVPIRSKSPRGLKGFDVPSGPNCMVFHVRYKEGEPIISPPQEVSMEAFSGGPFAPKGKSFGQLPPLLQPPPQYSAWSEPTTALSSPSHTSHPPYPSPLTGPCRSRATSIQEVDGFLSDIIHTIETKFPPFQPQAQDATEDHDTDEGSARGEVAMELASQRTSRKSSLVPPSSRKSSTSSLLSMPSDVEVLESCASSRSNSFSFEGAMMVYGSAKDPMRTCSTPPVPRTCATPPTPRTCSTPPTPKICSNPLTPRTCQTPPLQRTCHTPPMQRTCPTPPSPRTCPTPPTPKNCPTPPLQRSCSTPPIQKSSSTPPLQRACPTPPNSRGCATPPMPRTCSTPPMPRACPTPPPSVAGLGTGSSRTFPTMPLMSSAKPQMPKFFSTLPLATHSTATSTGSPVPAVPPKNRPVPPPRPLHLNRPHFLTQVGAEGKAETAGGGGSGCGLETKAAVTRQQREDLIDVRSLREGLLMKAPMNASMATGSGGGASGGSTCGCCGERFVEPRLLPCLHTFCTPCLQARVVYLPQQTQSLGNTAISTTSTPAPTSTNNGPVPPPPTEAQQEKPFGSPVPEKRSPRAHRQKNGHISSGSSASDITIISVGECEKEEVDGEGKKVRLPRRTVNLKDHLGEKDRGQKPGRPHQDPKTVPTSSPLLGRDRETKPKTNVTGLQRLEDILNGLNEINDFNGHEENRAWRGGGGGGEGGGGEGAAVPEGRTAQRPQQVHKASINKGLLPRDPLASGLEDVPPDDLYSVMQLLSSLDHHHPGAGDAGTKPLTAPRRDSPSRKGSVDLANDSSTSGGGTGVLTSTFSSSSSRVPSVGGRHHDLQSSEVYRSREGSPAGGRGVATTDPAAHQVEGRLSSSCHDLRSSKKDLLHSQGSGGGTWVLWCPECGHEAEVPAGGVECLPLNYVLQNQLVLQALNSSSTTVYCDLCSQDVRAEERCNTCMLNLCRLCAHAHARQRRTAHHTLLSLQEARALGIREVPRTLLCSSHGDGEVNWWCQTCDEPLCSICLASSHRHHHSAPVHVQAPTARANLQHLLQASSSRVCELLQAVEGLSGASSRLQLRAHAVSDHVNRFIDDYIEAIEEHRQALLRQVRRACDGAQRGLVAESQRAGQTAAWLRQGADLAQDLLRQGGDAETLSLAPIIVNRLQALLETPAPDGADRWGHLELLENHRAGVVRGHMLTGVLADTPAHPARCQLKASCDLARVLAGSRAEVLVLARDRQGHAIPHGGERLQAQVVAHHLACECEVRDREDGSYLVSFTPTLAAPVPTPATSSTPPTTAFLHVTLRGVHVQGSPLAFTVVEPRRSKSHNQSPRPAGGPGGGSAPTPTPAPAGTGTPTPTGLGVSGIGGRHGRAHTGVYHCCTFCSTAGDKAVTCACGGTMPGGYRGCGHNHTGHPGHKHWSCCAQPLQTDPCTRPASSYYQVTL